MDGVERLGVLDDFVVICPLTAGKEIMERRRDILFPVSSTITHQLSGVRSIRAQ